MRHSPGPWKVGYRALDVMAESHVSGKGPMKVCDIRGWGYLTGKGHGALGLPQEEAAAIQYANAALIAASPALYEYVASSASAGCATAQKLIAEIKSNSKEQ
jgi:hypothetical protein